MARLCLFGLLALAFAAIASASADGADAPFDAVAWIQIKSHSADGPDSGDLQELQGSNPEAYALVKALLVKNSLGLIRRKETPPMEVDNPVSDESAVAAPPTVHKSFFNWKPPDYSDEVQSVLGQVRETMAGIARSTALKLDAPPPKPVEAPPPPPKDVNAEAWRLMSQPIQEDQPKERPKARSLGLREKSFGLSVVVAPDPAEKDIFSKGASQVSDGEESAAKHAAVLTSKRVVTSKTAARDAGSSAAKPVGSAFWSGIFQPKAWKERQQVKEAKKAKKQAALPATTNYIKSFDWNSDDGDDKTESSSASSSTAAVLENKGSSSSSSSDNTPQNRYMKFLS